MKIKIEEIVPKRSHTESTIKIDFTKNKAILSWRNKGGGKHPKPMKVLKKFTVDQETIALMGFFFGDGLKSNNGAAPRTVSFTNSEPKTVKWAMKLFKILSINNSKLKASVSVRGEIDKNKVRGYWTKITKVPAENISVNIRPSMSLGKRNLPQVKKYGAIKLEFYSAVLRDVLLGLLNFAIMQAKKDSKSAKAFLKGLAAAEGSPVLRHGKLINVVISCCDEKNKRIIQEIIKQCKLVYRVRSDGIEIHRNNFKRRKNNDIFSYHPDRHNRLMFGLKSLNF